MKAFILAAGFGTRLRPITEDIPKPLIPVVNIPSIGYTIALLKEAGITEIIVNLHWKGDVIKQFFIENKNFGMSIEFSFEEEILGTGGGVKKCESLLSDEPFIIINSDIITDISIKEVINFYMHAHIESLLVIHKLPHTQNGTIAIGKKKITDINNLLHTNNILNHDYMGIAILSPHIFKYLHPTPSSIVSPGFLDLIKHHSLHFYEHTGMWQDIGTLDSFLKTSLILMENKNYLSRIQRHIQYQIDYIHKTSEILPDVTIINSIVGENCSISSGSHIENSVILPDSKITSPQSIQNSLFYKQTVLLGCY